MTGSCRLQPYTRMSQTPSHTPAPEDSYTVSGTAHLCRTVATITEVLKAMEESGATAVYFVAQPIIPGGHDAKMRVMEEAKAAGQDPNKAAEALPPAVGLVDTGRLGPAGATMPDMGDRILGLFDEVRSSIAGCKIMLMQQSGMPEEHAMGITAQVCIKAVAEPVAGHYVMNVDPDPEQQGEAFKVTTEKARQHAAEQATKTGQAKGVWPGGSPIPGVSPRPVL